jgi:hypothetical protein
MQTAQKGLRHDRVPNPLGSDDQRTGQGLGSLVRVEMLAILEFVHRAAIRALGLARLAHIQKNIGVRIPSLHFGQRIGTHDSALVVQVFDQEFNVLHIQLPLIIWGQSTSLRKWSDPQYITRS